MLIFIYHIPRLLYQLLHVSYSYVFNNPSYLTANPSEHLKRANKILNRKMNSDLLYAAIEIRFALERMADTELVFAKEASNKSLKEYDPVKKLSNLHRIDEDTKKPHEIYILDKKSGKRLFKWGNYKPLDKTRVNEIKGRLGDILHPKRGLSLGSINEPWYVETRCFLEESLLYLSERYKDNTPFFSFEDLDHVEMLKTEECNQSVTNQYS